MLHARAHMDTFSLYRLLKAHYGALSGALPFMILAPNTERRILNPGPCNPQPGRSRPPTWIGQGMEREEEAVAGGIGEEEEGTGTCSGGGRVSGGRRVEMREGTGEPSGAAARCVCFDPSL